MRIIRMLGDIVIVQKITKNLGMEIQISTRKNMSDWFRFNLASETQWDHPGVVLNIELLKRFYFHIMINDNRHMEEIERTKILKPLIKKLIRKDARKEALEILSICDEKWYNSFLDELKKGSDNTACMAIDFAKKDLVKAGILENKEGDAFNSSYLGED